MGGGVGQLENTFEDWVVARGGTCDHTAMTCQYVGDETMINGSQHSNHPDRLKGLYQAANSGPPGDACSKAAHDPVIAQVKGWIHINHEVGCDGGYESGCKGARGEAKVLKEEVGLLIPGGGQI